MEPDAQTEGLTILGDTVRHPIEHLECFPITEVVSRVRLTSDELVSVCPVTGQPDISSIEIDYRPDALCIETKALKLYLWKFRDRPIFCESLAAEIADEVMATAAPHEVTVTVQQHPRGGIVIEATATRER
jgi:7-cyano-7-deazaguanine reductase